MKLKIDFPTEVLWGIQGHLQSTYPEEGCGFFAGVDGDPRVVRAFYPVANVQQDIRAKRFQISPADYLAAERWAERLGVSLLGIYHSHPDHPAKPSETDLAHAVPWFSYLIVTTTEDGVGPRTSWQLGDEGAFVEEEVRVLKE